MLYNWEGIAEFVTVAETQSFTLAAKKLGISTAHVSRQVSDLESRLATKLELWSNLVYEHQAVFLSDCSITCSPSWNLTLLTTRVSS